VPFACSQAVCAVKASDSYLWFYFARISAMPASKRICHPLFLSLCVVSLCLYLSLSAWWQGQMERAKWWEVWHCEQMRVSLYGGPQHDTHHSYTDSHQLVRIMPPTLALAGRPEANGPLGKDWYFCPAIGNQTEPSLTSINIPEQNTQGSYTQHIPYWKSHLLCTFLCCDIFLRVVLCLIGACANNDNS